jgi:hypothetical protein
MGVATVWRNQPGDVPTPVGESCVDLTGIEPEWALVNGPEYLVLYATPNCTMPCGTGCTVVKPAAEVADLTFSNGGLKSALLLHVYP